MNESNARNLCQMIKENRTNVQDEGTPSVITEDLKKQD
jgi:hypothetical protein